MGLSRSQASEQKEEQMRRPARLQLLRVFEEHKKAGVAGTQQAGREGSVEVKSEG